MYINRLPFLSCLTFAMYYKCHSFRMSLYPESRNLVSNLSTMYFQVLVVICGTRMIPTPKMKDVFMDLHADAEPFLDGVAHRGMAAGAKNILGKIMPK